jgi:hypothetical protein
MKISKILKPIFNSIKADKIKLNVQRTKIICNNLNQSININLMTKMNGIEDFS